MDSEYNIEKYIESLIQSHGSLDVAEAEFKRLLAEDADLKSQYKQWCEDTGYSTRNGFAEYAEEYMEGRESVWDSLSDYDDDNE